MRASPLGAVVWRIALHATAFGLVVFVLWRAAPFLKLAAVSLVLAAALESPIPALTDRGWPRALAVALTCVLTAAVLAGTLLFLISRIAPEVQQAASSGSSGFRSSSRSPS